MNHPFQLSDSLNSSVSVSKFSEKKKTLLTLNDSNTKANAFQDKKILKKRARKYLIMGFVITIAISAFCLFRFGIYASDILKISFPNANSKTLTDDNTYQIIQLKNNLQIGLISNPNCIVSYFSMTISYGTSNDPEYYSGLCHLVLKTKLALAIEEYIKINNVEIKHFNLSYHINEETSKISFEIEQKFFWDIITKLVNSINTQEEPSNIIISNALESINRHYDKLKANNDYRELQIINSLLYEKDNFIGNIESLEGNQMVLSRLKTNLIKAFNRYYVSDNMKIVIETIDEISSLVDKANNKFKLIKNNSKNKKKYNSFQINKLKRKNLGQVIWIHYYTFHRRIKLLFILSKTTKEAIIFYEYLTYIMNKKEVDSIYHKLQGQNLIFNFNSKITKILSTHIQLELCFDLLTLGEYLGETIIKKVFEYLNNPLLYQINQDRYREFIEHKQNMISFKEESQYERVEKLMLYLNDHLSLDDYKSFTQSSFAINQNMNNYLTPANCIIILESDIKSDFTLKIFRQKSDNIQAIESHFQSLYHTTLIEKETMVHLQSKKNEPINLIWTPNKFMTNHTKKIDYDTNVNSIETNEMEPEKIIQTNNYTVWYRLDRSFKLPKAIIYINIISPFIRSQNSKYYFLHKVFFNTFKNQILINLHSAIEAGNKIAIEVNNNGFTLTIDAYTDVIWKIMDEIDKTTSEFEYFQMLSLKHVSRSYFNKIIKFNDPSFDTKMSMAIYDAETNQIFSTISHKSVFTILFYGNINKEEIVLKIRDYSDSSISATPPKISLNDHESIEEIYNIIHHQHYFIGSYSFYFINKLSYDTNQFLDNYFLLGKITDDLIIEASIMLEIINDISEQYIILGERKSIKLLTIDDMVYYNMRVEHYKMNPDLIDNQLDVIIDALHMKINEMSNEIFDAYKNKVLFDLRLRYNSLSHKAHLVWNEIHRSTYEFKRKTISLFILQYTKDHLVTFYQKTFINEYTLRKISIQLYKSSDIIPFTEIKSMKYKLNDKINTIITNDISIIMINDDNNNQHNHSLKQSRFFQ